MESSAATTGSAPLPTEGEVRVNVHYAKTNLSKLLERVEQGEDIVICRNGEPVARLAAWTEPILPRTGFGAARGLGWFDGMDDFVGQTTDEEVLRAIYGDDFDMDAERAFFEDDQDA